MSKNRNEITRFYSLDVLRGVAALGIVFFHWQHFFFIGTESGSFDISGLPLFQWLYLLYTKGYLAVDLFFFLSGFIFYWLYSQQISSGGITFKKFFWLRFSRLYPLHIATLLIVAISQKWVLYETGSYFVYEYNDIKHFLLNLFFISSWGFEQGFSFNGPVWSVSVEVLLYMLFFLICRLFPLRIKVLTLTSIAGFIIMSQFYNPVGRGIGAFFFGGCMFFAYEAIISSNSFRATTRFVVSGTAWAWLITLAFPFLKIETSPLLAASFTTFQPDFSLYIQWGYDRILMMWPFIVLFPLTILSLVLIETRTGTLGKRLSFLGDISYAVYLIHFPLQFLFYVIVTTFTSDLSIYYKPWFMIFFFIILILVSLFSYRFYEKPTQIYLRKVGPKN